MSWYTDRSSSTGPSVDVSLIRHMTISLWGFSPHDTGHVACMSFSPDYNALAVGWSLRGLIVWSIGSGSASMASSGHAAGIVGGHGGNGVLQSASSVRLLCTLPHIGISDSPPFRTRRLPMAATNNTLSIHELLQYGASAVNWTAAGFGLIATGNAPRQKVSISLTPITPTPVMGSPSSGASTPAASSPSYVLTQLLKFPFYHSAIGYDSGHNEETNMVLLGDDRILLWRGRRDGGDGDEAAEDHDDSDHDDDFDEQRDQKQRVHLMRPDDNEFSWYDTHHTSLVCPYVYMLLCYAMS
jgi:WD40 repeat protein